MAKDIIQVRENVQGFKEAPRYEPFDMVVLYIDDKTFVSSPNAVIDKDAWEEGTLGGTNGEFVFEYDTAIEEWKYDGTPVDLGAYGITTHFAVDTAQEQDGDKITVIRMAEEKDNGETTVDVDIELSRPGRILDGDCPLVKPSQRQALADSILAQVAGFQYKPYEATDAEVNPLADIGDGIAVHGVYSGIFEQTTTFSKMMTSDVGAPWEEETDKEFTYQTETERKYTRKFADIETEFEITASQISAKVSKTGGSRSSFAWELLDSYFSLLSNDTEVFRVDSTGAHVMGEITATSGYIGSEQNGFAITASAIMNGMTSFDDTEHNGVYIGTDGISLGGGAFKVSDLGDVEASNLDITGGSISIGNKFRVDSEGNLTASSGTFEGNVQAKNIQYGGSAGTFSGSGLSGGSVGSGKITSGSLGGSQFTSKVNSSLGDADFSADVFSGSATANYVNARNLNATGTFKYNGTTFSPVVYHLMGYPNGNEVTIRPLRSAT